MRYCGFSGLRDKLRCWRQERDNARSFHRVCDHVSLMPGDSAVLAVLPSLLQPLPIRQPLPNTPRLPIVPRAGFRFVQLVGWPTAAAGPPPAGTFTALFVHTDAAIVGAFNSSNAVLNAVMRASLMSERSVLHSVPLDCPQARVAR